MLLAILIFGLPHLSLNTDGLLLLKLHTVISTRKSEWLICLNHDFSSHLTENLITIYG